MSDRSRKRSSSTKEARFTTEVSDDNYRTNLSEEGDAGEHLTIAKELEEEEGSFSSAQSQADTTESMLLQILSSVKSLETRMTKIENRDSAKAITKTPTKRATRERQSILQSVMNSGRKHWKDILREAREESDEEDSEQEELSQDEFLPSSDVPTSTTKKKATHTPSKGKLFQALGANTAAAQQTVTVTRQEKECKVRINNFELSRISKAVKDIMQFQEEENTQVRMVKILSQSCKAHLQLKYGIQSDELQRMSLENLFEIISQETRVHSRVEFYEQLEAALGHVKLMEWSAVTPVNHEVFYFQQLKLIDEFQRLLRIMLVNNQQHCPRVDDKENGLIRLFKKINSNSYIRHVLPSMTKPSYDSMGEFFKEYGDICLDHYNLSLAVKGIPYANNVKETQKQREYYQRRRELSNDNSGKGRSYTNSNSNHLSNVELETTEQDECWRDANPVLDQKAGADQSDDSVSVASNQDNSESEENDQETSDYDTNEEHVETLLAAFGNHEKVKTTADRKGLPCLRKLLSGKCEYDECQYGHKSDVLMKGAQDMRSKLNAFLQSQGQPNKDNPSGISVLNRGQSRR